MLQKIIAGVLVVIALIFVVRKFYHQLKGTSGTSCPFCDQACNQSEKDSEDESSGEGQDNEKP